MSGQHLSLLHIPTQHLSFLTISFVSLCVFFSMIVLLPFSLSVNKSFTFKLLRKNGVMQKFKVQFATYEKWRLKLRNCLFQPYILLAIFLKQQDVHKSRYINVHLTLQHFMYFYFETFSQKIYKVYNIFFVKIYFFNSLFLFYLFWKL